MGRAVMEPGHAVFDEIVARFGKEIVTADGRLDRRTLAAIAFDAKNPRIEELNALVHPAVLAEQAKRVAQLRAEKPHAIAVVESALIFSAKSGAGERWQDRFDAVVMVTAPTEVKIARFVTRASGGRELSADERAAFEADGRARLAQQKANAEHEHECLVIHNDSTVEALRAQAEVVWKQLVERERTL
ncbi:dephospho-CoA kinase [Granulicella cerasi]|uniref:Dephospho-CoA kinase n=2 Tax=Granulicella cerasi TaxID=741063 RepID=A0ABW1ZE20_9BACT